MLPPGIHWASLAEVATRFATTAHRMELFEGILRAAENLKNAGCSTLYIDGSYTTDKSIPSDFDGCWDPTGVSGSLLDPVLLDFTDGRQKQKEKYGGELFISTLPNTPGDTFLDFFQRDKFTGLPKGIIAIPLQGSPP